MNGRKKYPRLRHTERRENTDPAASGPNSYVDIIKN